MWTGIAQSVWRLATGWVVRESNPGRSEIFRTRPDRPWGPPSPLYQRWPNSRSRPLFSSLSKFICRLSTINSSSSDSIFGSIYLCEEALSQMKIIKSRYQSRLNDEHLKYRLHLCLSNYEHPFSKLSQDMQCHASASQ